MTNSNPTKGDSCMPGFNVVVAQPEKWTPLAPDEYAAKFVVASNVNHSKETAGAVTHAQKTMLTRFGEELSDTKLLMNVETFQDDCRHQTGWSTKPRDIASTSTRWHCYQTNTRFHEALSELRQSDQKVNALFIIGDRFDDDLKRTVTEARALNKEKGTRIFALPLTTEDSVNKAYKSLANATDGAYLPAPDSQTGMRALIEEIVQVAISEEVSIELPPPANPQLRAVRKEILRLTHGGNS